MFYCFKRTISDIYALIISISSKTLNQVQLKSKALLKQLSNPNSTEDSGSMEESARDLEEFERMKKIKDAFSWEDMMLLMQLLVPVLLIGIIGITFAAVLTTSLRSYDEMTSSTQDGYAIVF